MFVIKLRKTLLQHPHYVAGTYGNDSLHTVLDPAHARHFKIKQDAQHFIDNHLVETDEFTIVTLKYAHNRWSKILKNGVVIGDLCHKSPLSRPYNQEKPDQVLKWWIECTKMPDDSIAFADFKTWPNLYSIFEHLWDVREYWDDDYKQKFLSFAIRVKRNSKFGKFKCELKKVLPYITLKDEDGNIILDVFDHYLSEGGNSVNLVIIDDNHWKIVGRYGDGVEGTPSEVFDYLCRCRYYE